jgi:DNA invertase Pin-like site-specific DNA recombinase
MAPASSCRNDTNSGDSTPEIPQIKACEKLAEIRGYTLGQVFREDWPGDSLDRPLLDQLRARVRGRDVFAVVIYVMDRLAGDPILQAIIALELEKHQVDLLCVLDPPANSPEDQLLRYIKGYASAIERAQNS